MIWTLVGVGAFLVVGLVIGVVVFVTSFSGGSNRATAQRQDDDATQSSEPNASVQSQSTSTSSQSSELEAPSDPSPPVDDDPIIRAKKAEMRAEIERSAEESQRQAEEMRKEIRGSAPQLEMPEASISEEPKPEPSAEEKRARLISKLQSGDSFRTREALEAIADSPQFGADEELTGILVAMLQNPPRFLRLDHILGALRNCGAAACLEPMRELMKDGQLHIFDKRDVALAIQIIEERLGFKFEPGDPLRSPAGLEVGDRVFVQVNGVWTAGNVIQVLPREYYRVAARGMGVLQEGTVTMHQLRSPARPRQGAASHAGTARGPEWRMWTDASGQFRVEAALVELDDEQVKLKKKADGLIVTLPLSQLSEEDQKFLRERSQKE